ncbi:hypothetical protein [Streptomyces sasae]|uniref:hypothetical protein n=1 Tax=Streptomyces sasae TaxID=1266772 RepID=UPI002930A606|nr:hypothetical protein [Streptomyces sasae]
MNGSAFTTQLAGQALADSLKSLVTNGIDAPQTLAAAQVATVMITAALNKGATLTDIRRAAGLPT